MLVIVDMIDWFCLSHFPSRIPLLEGISIRSQQQYRNMEREILNEFFSNIYVKREKRESLILLFHGKRLASTLHIGLIYIHTHGTHNTVRQ